MSVPTIETKRLGLGQGSLGQIEGGMVVVDRCSSFWARIFSGGGVRGGAWKGPRVGAAKQLRPPKTANTHSKASSGQSGRRRGHPGDASERG
jgi:hypothetical protein